jgi:DNA-binding NtrC family response regulator
MPSNKSRVPWEVLVVDDDEGIRDLIISYFTTLGVIVTGTHDGRAAIAALQRSNGRYGMVVTDLTLPGADGFAVLQAARQANSQCYVVIVTGYASLDSAIHAVRVGAYDYLTKPFSMGQLDVILNRVTERIALEQSHRSAPTGSAPSTPAATGFDQVASRIEAALARIEARLQTGVAVPLRRL